MRIHIQSTTKIVDLETPRGIVPARVWEGFTESGIPVHVFVTRIAPTTPKDDPRLVEFERELQECQAPTAAIQWIPLRLIL